MADQCCCYYHTTGGAGLGRLMIERRQQEILTALTRKTMPTSSGGIAVGLFRFRADRESFHGSTRNQKGKLFFPRFAFAWQKAPPGCSKGIRQMNEQSTNPACDFELQMLCGCVLASATGKACVPWSIHVDMSPALMPQGSTSLSTRKARFVARSSQSNSMLLYGMLQK